jgi:hypothetical protein
MSGSLTPTAAVSSAGWLNNGVVRVQPRIQNGVTVSPVPTTNLGSRGAAVSVDVNNAAGQQPETAAASPFQIAAAAGALINNTVTSTVHTGTLNTTSGMMVTEALTTAAGATYTFQIVNSLFTTTGPLPEVQMHDGTNTAGNQEVTSVAILTTGTATAVFTNTGTAAWNGTKLIPFHV